MRIVKHLVCVCLQIKQMHVQVSLQLVASGNARQRMIRTRYLESKQVFSKPQTWRKKHRQLRRGSKYGIELGVRTTQW